MFALIINKANSEGFYLRQMLRRIGLTLAIFTCCRIAFYIINRTILPIPTVFDFLWGLWFDASAAAYVNLFLWMTYTLPLPIRNKTWFKTFQKTIFILTNFIALFVELADVSLFHMANRRALISDFGLLGNTLDMVPKFLQEDWYYIIAIILILFLLSKLYDLTTLKYPEEENHWLPQTGVFVISSLLFVLMARGGIQLRPLTPLSSAEVASDMRLMPLVSNTTLNLIHSYGQDFINEKSYMSPTEAEAIYPIFKTPTPTDTFRPLNVVVIALESFGKEYSKFFNPNAPGEHGMTPFLDSLIQQSAYCENSFANGLRSTQGIVGITAGLPSLMEDPFMFSPYQSNRVDGLAAHLKSKGYSTAFFHGSNPGSMDFDKFASLTGFDTFYDRYGFGNQAEYDGMWGIWDEPMFQFMIDKLNVMPQPFYGFIFSMTSHHPFKTPEWFEKKYPNMDPHERSFRYTDYALSKFFERAQTMPWFKNTLFVLSADHTGRRSTNPEYQTKLARFKIPILFYKPNEIKPMALNQTCQQVDILPTVLEYLNYDKSYLSFGRNIFKPEKHQYAFQYEEGFYQLEDNQYILFFDGSRTTGMYDYHSDIFLKNNLQDKLPADKERMEKVLKSVIQQYNKAMINNQLVK